MDTDLFKSIERLIEADKQLDETAAKALVTVAKGVAEKMRANEFHHRNVNNAIATGFTIAKRRIPL